MNLDDCVPKLIGGDIELANFIVGGSGFSDRTDAEASGLLLAQISGLPLSDRNGNRMPAGPVAHGGNGGGRSRFNAQDRGRRYLPANGGCIYIDLNHLELATPEVLSACDHQAVWAAMLSMAREAQVAVNAGLPDGQRAAVLVNNSDRQGHSYGAHQSFLMSRTAWDRLIRKRSFVPLSFLMAYQVSSIVFTGQGKVGSENGHTPVPYQISQRADFMETLLGEQTTYNRPLINTRDEPLCGPTGTMAGVSIPGDRYARLHVIFYDANLAPVATFLKVGVMQLILTMIEAEQVDSRLMLEAPLAALHAWSRDVDLETRLPLIGGDRVTAVELQMRFLKQAREFDARHGFADFVPGAQQILGLWEDTLVKLRTKDFASLRGRLDWVMKRAVLEQALAAHRDLRWDSPEIMYLDQTYSSIDPADSVFLSLAREDMFEPVATQQQIADFVDGPPHDTRAWTRAMLLRAVAPERVTRVDWDSIELKTFGGASHCLRIGLPDPLAATRASSQPAFAAATSFSELLDALIRSGIDARIYTRYTLPEAGALDGYGTSQTEH